MQQTTRKMRTGEVGPEPPSLEGLKLELLTAESDKQVDAVFDKLFVIVNDALTSQDFSVCSALLQWMAPDEVAAQLHTELLISLVRLTYRVRDECEGWSEALDAMERQFDERGEPTEILLCGLR